MKVINELKSRGVKVIGFFCPEVREKSTRIGFKIVDINTGDSDWLALEISRAKSLGYGIGPRVGKYVVIPQTALKIGLRALGNVSEADILAIDELGPMELKLSELRTEIIRALKNSRNSIVVTHWNLRDLELLNILRDSKKYIVTFQNRNYLAREILNTILSALSIE